MATVIRVKRRTNDEQFDKFVVKCKRRKTGDDSESPIFPTATNLLQSEDETSTILKLAATVQSEEEISAQIHRLTKTEAEEVAKKVPRATNLTAKNRKQIRTDAQNSRFKVVNCYRAIGNESNATDSDLMIVNIEKEIEPVAETATTTAEPSMPAMESDFVFDLYVVDGTQNVEIDYENLISIRPFDDLVYQATDDAYNESEYEDEDSNDENNWRNDYPDTDEDFSVGEDDMRRAVEDLNLGSNDELSSDESEYEVEPPIHFLNAEKEKIDEYGYFKRHGQIRANRQYYRKSRAQRAVVDDSDSDSDTSSGMERRRKDCDDDSD